MSSRRFVVNASPLIYLPQADCLHLLRELASEVVVPEAVVEEVGAGSYRQLESPRIETVEWLRIEPDLPVPPEIAGWDLGAGESQVLAHTASSTAGTQAVLDDLQARRCAQSLGLGVIGTLGVILRSKRLGLLRFARPPIEELLRRGMYLGRDLIEAALREVGE